MFGDLGAKIGPQTVTPVVAYLASEDCELNGEILSVAGGRVARVFLAETNGYVLPELNAEAVRDNLGAIFAEAGYHTPASLAEECAIVSLALLSPAEASD